MKREIKFRAWDTINKRWATDVPFTILTHTNNKALFELQSDGIEWMQYTGLRDKHGVEIYEGDIVACDDGGEYFTYEGHKDYPEKYPITWSDDGAAFFLKGKEDLEFSPFYDYCTFEVIGNIYQNPELLK